MANPIQVRKKLLPFPPRTLVQGKSSKNDYYFLLGLKLEEEFKQLTFHFRAYVQMK